MNIDLVKGAMLFTQENNVLAYTFEVMK